MRAYIVDVQDQPVATDAAESVHKLMDRIIGMIILH